MPDDGNDLIGGGQGRSGKDVADSAFIAGVCLVGMFLVLGLYLLWWALR